MTVRIPLAIFVLATLAVGPAHADVFRCGKTFMTFTALDDVLAEYDSITIRKADVRRVFSPARNTGMPAHMVFNTPGGQLDIAFISEGTHARILECLD